MTKKTGNPLLDGGQMVSSYIDLKSVAEKVTKMSLEFSMMWLEHLNTTMDGVLKKLEKDDQKGAQKAFLNALDNASKNTEKMTHEMSTFIAEQICDTYGIAYHEGASQACHLNAKTLRQLIADGMINDDDGAIDHYLTLCTETHDKAMQERMKGRSYNIYQLNKKEEK